MNLLFDLDGTLTDPKPGFDACVRHAMQALGQPLSPELELEGYIGPPLQDTFAKLLRDASQVPRAVELYRERYTALGMFENSVYHDIPRVLEALRQQAKLFVATSKPRVFAEKILAHFELAKHFQAIYGSELDGTRTDKGELIGHLLLEQDLSAAACVMIGDREHDILGAKKHGLHTVGVLWGYGSEQELRRAGAEGVAKEPGQLLALVEP